MGLSIVQQNTELFKKNEHIPLWNLVEPGQAVENSSHVPGFLPAVNLYVQCAAGIQGHRGQRVAAEHTLRKTTSFQWSLMLEKWSCVSPNGFILFE